MWVLDDCVKSSWSKCYEINLKSLSKKPTYIPMKSKKKKQKPPAFESFFNKDTLFVAAGGIGKHFSDFVRIILHDNDRLFMYDLKSQELKEFGALDNKLAICAFDYAVFHTNSLVSWE
ncbi:hypothetical protein FRX31_022670 [Thalictrum thalictroides]|uniref:Uncharacterized protein n=1 Tax=Thalictrum thalictroides TaxID=46969 RepID=A0A7J6VTL8_THATH|nr:hypothetical protein FRX31_022670 [Thalictrum thalictroides]